MSFQEMYGLRGPWGQTAVLQLTYELRPKWQNKTQNAVSRSDPLQGSDNKLQTQTRIILPQLGLIQSDNVQTTN